MFDVAVAVASTCWFYKLVQSLFYTALFRSPFSSLHNVYLIFIFQPEPWTASAYVWATFHTTKTSSSISNRNRVYVCALQMCLFVIFFFILYSFGWKDIIINENVYENGFECIRVHFAHFFGGQIIVWNCRKWNSKIESIVACDIFFAFSFDLKSINVLSLKLIGALAK